MLDLLVAGGGPAGLATALHARLAGLSVAVVEPRAGPIDKACGEGLMPTAVARLRALGVPVEGWPFRGIAYVDAAHRVEAGFAGGAGMGVRRTALHAALRERVDSLGIEVLAGRVTSVTQTSTSVSASGPVSAEGLRARYLAAADGLHSPIRRSLGLELTARTGAAAGRYGLRRHFAVAPWSDYVEVHWAAGSEAYVTPVSPDLVGVAVLTSRRAGFTEQLEAFPSLSSHLAGAPVATSARGAGPLCQRVRRRVSGRVLLVGDAAGYVDALTGEGIALSLAAAEALVACVARDRPNDYERAWRGLSRRYRWLTGSLLWARRRKALAPRIVPLAAQLPRVFRAAVNQLA
ncbi:NAD(P)/FAD-dependent oxidoreductase [Flindersiella endophytica]